MTRNGLTPEQAVFGRALRWPGVAGTADENEIPLASLGTEGEAWLASQIRAAARMALLSRDASDKIRRATLRRAPAAIAELTPGTRVYFWSPHPMKGRQRQDALRWRGPATVIARESVGRYYVGWRSRVLMVAKDQLRLATTEEAAAHEVIGKDMAMTADPKCYQDMTGAPPPARRQPAAAAPVLPPLQNLPSANRALQDVLNAEQEKETGQDRLLKDVAQQDPKEVAVAQVPLALPEPLQATLAVMNEAPDDGRLSAQKRGILLDDMPQSMKKSKVGAAQFPYLVTFMIQGNGADWWLKRGEFDGLASLTGFKVTGVRLHHRPRRKPFEHENHRHARRLTLMRSHKTQEIEVLDEGPGVARDAEKVPGYWTGLTIFYEKRPKYEARTQVRYVDTPVGLVETVLSQAEADDVKDIFETRCGFVADEGPGGADTLNQVYLLSLKNNMKELDQKVFEQKEKQAFDEAKTAEWEQWLTSGAVAIAPEKEEKKIARELIFTASMRFVRTNKSKQPEELQPEERIAKSGMLTLHVDDGVLAGDCSHRVYQNAVKDINIKYNIMDWHELKMGTANYLGMRWKQDDQRVTLDMGDYIGNLTEMEMKKPTNEDVTLGDGALHMFRSTLAKVRWPVSHVVPKLAYAVSSLAQVSPVALEWEQARPLNLVVVALKKMAQAGQAQIVLPRWRGDKVTGVTPFDASFAKGPGMQNREGFVSFLTTGDITRGEVLCALVEFHSTTTSRVVKSMLTSLSTALDRQLYLRLLHGEPTYTPERRHKLTMPGILVTDAKSLYDHLNTTGRIPKERQNMIDLLLAWDLIEANAVKLMWVHARRTLADILTKMMLAGDISKMFREKQVFLLIRNGEKQE